MASPGGIWRKYGNITTIQYQTFLNANLSRTADDSDDNCTIWHCGLRIIIEHNSSINLPTISSHSNTFWAVINIWNNIIAFRNSEIVWHCFCPRKIWNIAISYHWNIFLGSQGFIWTCVPIMLDETGFEISVPSDTYYFWYIRRSRERSDGLTQRRATEAVDSGFVGLRSYRVDS